MSIMCFKFLATSGMKLYLCGSIFNFLLVEILNDFPFRHLINTLTALVCTPDLITFGYIFHTIACLIPFSVKLVFSHNLTKCKGQLLFETGR